ncbi:MAG: N-acetylmuramoyl-L-alanine amidase [Thioalkalispiraceae bacterium]|jgi:N-acetylmuramoyl-L-alanine amidase
MGSMRTTLRSGFICLLLATASLVQAATVNGVRMWPAPDHTRLVFDLNAPVEHSLFTLDNPERVVIDLKTTEFHASLPAISSGAFIKNIRYARRGQGDLRIVLDLNRKVTPKSFALKPHREYGNRLVVDLVDSSEAKPRSPVRRDTDIPDKPRDVIIAIDAGHGGDDPGAIGRRGTKEKNVVLGIARELKKLVDLQPGMKGKLIRNGDYYIGLDDRVKKARELQADLFISIHADAFRNRRARGSSVYVLSERGASSEVARFLAESENSSDLIGGVNLDDKGDLLKLVLVDMLKNSTMEESNDVARHMISGLKRVNHMHKRHVEEARFRVLTAPDIPSVLIETAFISNPKEEKNLRSRYHQRKIATAILKGTIGYFKDNPPPGTILAIRDREHKIRSGDTLSELAKRYQVSMHDIRRANGLKNDLLQVGDVLRIPLYSTSDS